MGFYKNNWGVCIIADLNCGKAEDLFNLKIDVILDDLMKEGRDYYITLIINSEFGFLKKLRGVIDDGSADTEIRTVIYQNSALPEVKDFQDISKREIVKELISQYHIGKASSKLNAVITWGHGMAYSIFKQPSQAENSELLPSNEDKDKHFQMLNDTGFKNIFIGTHTISSNETDGHTSGGSVLPPPHISNIESKHYLSMDELALAIWSSFGRKIDLLVLSNCGMAYARTGITLSKVTDYWIAGEQYTSSYAIMPDNFLAALKNREGSLSPKDFGISLCMNQTESNSSFRLYEMKHFARFNTILRNFSKAIYVNIRSHSDLLMEARNNCMAIGDSTHVYYLISFFDFCKQIQNIDSTYSGIKFLQRFCVQLQELRKDLVITSDENDKLGLSIYFPSKSNIENPLSVDENIVIGIPLDTPPPVKFRKYLWEYNVLKLLKKE